MLVICRCRRDTGASSGLHWLMATGRGRKFIASAGRSAPKYMASAPASTRPSPAGRRLISHCSSSSASLWPRPSALGSAAMAWHAANTLCSHYMRGHHHRLDALSARHPRHPRHRSRRWPMPARVVIAIFGQRAIAAGAYSPASSHHLTNGARACKNVARGVSSSASPSSASRAAGGDACGR